MYDPDRRIACYQHIYEDTEIGHHFVTTHRHNPTITIGTTSLIFDNAAALRKLASAADDALEELDQ